MFYKKKLRTLIISIVFLIYVLLQPFSFADFKFNIEWLDLQIQNEQKSNNVVNNNWWGNNVNPYQIIANIQKETQQANALSKVIDKLEEKKQWNDFYTVWDYNWDWIPEIYFFHSVWDKNIIIDYYYYTNEWVYLSKQLANIYIYTQAKDNYANSLLKNIKVYKIFLWKDKTTWKIKTKWLIFFTGT